MEKGISLILAAIMASSSLPVTVSAETNVELLADFNFNDDETGFTGGNAKAFGTYSLTDSFNEANGKALYLDGSSSNFLTVTDLEGGSLLTGKEEITISMDMKPDRSDTNWLFYAAPNHNTQQYPNEYYLGVVGNTGNVLGQVKIERYANQGVRPACPETNVGSDWVHLDVVVAKDYTALYVNGVKRSETTQEHALKTILGNNSIAMIGKANWVSGEYYRGWIDNFKIYDGVLTEEELFDEEMIKEYIASDKDALTLPEKVNENFTLPISGAKGTSISWTVEDNEYAVIDTDGRTVKINRSEKENITVTFTATITMAGISDKKNIDVVIEKNFDDADVVAAALEKLDIVNKDAVKGNITLPTEIQVDDTDKLASVTWSSSSSAIVTDATKDGKAAGVVTRPAEDTKVVMTAEVSCGDAKATKEITLHVLAAPKDLDTDYTAGYLWSHFGISCGYESVFFGYSEDGLTWEKINKDASVHHSLF